MNWYLETNSKQNSILFEKILAVRGVFDSFNREVNISVAEEAYDGSISHHEYFPWPMAQQLGFFCVAGRPCDIACEWSGDRPPPIIDLDIPGYRGVQKLYTHSRFWAIHFFSFSKL